MEEPARRWRPAEAVARQLASSPHRRRWAAEALREATVERSAQEALPRPSAASVRHWTEQNPDEVRPPSWDPHRGPGPMHSPPSPSRISEAELRRQVIWGWRPDERLAFRPLHQSFPGPRGRQVLRNATFQELELEICARWANELRQPRTATVPEVVRLAREMMERQFSRLVHALMWSLPPDDTEVEAVRQRLREDRQRAREAGRNGGRARREAEEIQMRLGGGTSPSTRFDE